MKNLAFLKHVTHDRKAAIYTAAHDGKLRNFVYHEELGECRETFSRLLQDVQKGEIGVVMTPDVACLSIETSPGWMEAFIRAVKQHEVLIGDHSHDLVYDLREEEDEARFRDLYPQGEYERARSGPRPLVNAIAQSPFAAAYLERGENWFLLSRLEDEDPHTAIYSLSSGRLERTWTCLDWGAGGRCWMPSPPTGSLSRRAGVPFPRNGKTGSPARSDRRTRWPSKRLPP